VQILDSLRSLGMTAARVIPSEVEGSAPVLSIHDVKGRDGPAGDLCAQLRASV